MQTDTRAVVEFFSLVTVLTVPLWILGASIDSQLLPGLPIAALAVVCPALAAVILSLKSGGRRAVWGLLARAFDFRTAGWRLLLVGLANPILFSAAFLTSRSLGADLPDPVFTVSHVMMLTGLFLVTAALEEIGWTGYALGRLQARLGPLTAGLVLGAFCVVWHYPALVQVGHAAEWIAWWSVWSLAARVVIVWFYNWTGASVFAAVLYHALSNVCWQLYPINGSLFDPRISGLITFAFAAVLSIYFFQRHSRAGAHFRRHGGGR